MLIQSHDADNLIIALIRIQTQAIIVGGAKQENSLRYRQRFSREHDLCRSSARTA